MQKPKAALSSMHNASPMIYDLLRQHSQGADLLTPADARIKKLNS